MKNLTSKIQHLRSKRHAVAFISLLVIVVLTPLAVYISRNAAATRAAWWDDTYHYRQPFSFTHNATISADRAITLSLDTAELITDGILQSDCDDIRFTDVNGNPLLYDLTGTCNNAATTIEVIFPTIINGDNSAYIYYSNPSASNNEIDSSGYTALTPSGGDPSITTRTAEEVSPGPVGFWKFDEATDDTCSGGSNDICDGSGSGYDGAFGASTAAPSWQTPDLCISGYCLSFDGSDDVATITNADLIDFDDGLDSGVSVSFWVRPISDGENNQGEIFDKGSELYCRTTSEGSGQVDLECAMDLATTDPSVTITDALTLGSWHHVELTYADDADDDMLVYIDGSLAATGTGEGAPNGTDTSDILIGGDSSNNFHGSIDEFKIYNYERTPDQVNTDFIKGANSHGSGAVLGAIDYDPLNQGLAGYWKLDETTGNAADSSGFDTTLTNVSSTTFSPAKYGNGAEPDGTADYFDAVDNTALSITGDITLAAWIEPDDVSGDEAIIGKFDDADESYLLMQTGDEIRMYVDSSSNYQTTDAANLAADTLYHVAGAYNAQTQTVQLFVNGQLEASSTTGTIPASIGDDAGEFTIGAEDSGGTATNFFNGHIDEARVYHRSLSPAEIAQLYHHAPGPVGYWPMDENTGTSTTYDRSGNGNDGTLNGSMTADDWVPGKYGSALEFDGSDDHINISDNSLFDMIANSSFTISGWFKHDDISSSADYILTKSEAGTNAGYQVYMNSDGGISFDVDDDSTWGPDDALSSSTAGAGATISFVASAYDDGGAGADRSPAIPTGTAEDDFMIAFCIRGGNGSSEVWDDDGGGSNGWTRLVNNYTSPGRDAESAIFYKVATSSESTPTFTHGGSYASTCQITTYRNVDTSTPFDVTYSNATHHSSGTADNTPDAPDISTNTDDAWVVTIHGENFNEITSSGAPTNYTMRAENIASNRNTFFATRQISSAGSESIGSWTHSVSGTNGGTTHHVYTLALKPAIGSPTGNLYDDGAWHHFSAVRDSTDDYYLYVDGVLVDSEATVNATGDLSNNDPVYIGVNDDGTSNDWAGALDDIKIYNYARSAQQVTQDFNASHPTGGSPIASQVIHYPFDEATGTSISNQNSSQSSLTGSVSGASWNISPNCQTGACLDYDGTDDVTTVTNATAIDFDENLDTGFTISAWINADSDGESNQGQIFQKGTNTWCRVDNESGSDLDVECSLDLDTDATLNISAPITTNSWHHVAVGYSNDSDDEITIWVDGINYGSSNGGSGSPVTDANDLLIGGGTSNNFDGQIDEFKLYSSQLTDAQILIDMNAGSSANFGTGTNAAAHVADGDHTTDLVGYWPLDENTGTTTTYDQSASSNDGTLTSVDEADWVNGKHGSALELDGSAEFIDVGTGPTTVRTVTFWVNPQDTTEPFLNITSTTDYIDSSGGTVSATGFTSPSIYVNGILNGTVTASVWNHVAVTTSTAENASNFDIGRTADTNYLGGSIDDVKLFSSQLSTAQVAYEYNRGAPIGWWQFDECQDTTANDFGSAGNNLTITAGDTSGSNDSVGTCGSGNADEIWANGATGRYSASLDLDGTNDYASDSSTSNLPSGDVEKSMTAWFKTTCPNTWQILGGFGTNATGNNFQMEICEGSTLRIMGWGGGNDWNSTVSNTPYVDDNWHHMAVTYDGTNTLIYMDSIEVASTSSYSWNTSTNSIVIGEEIDLSGRAFSGQIDDFRIYNYDLSADQVKQVMSHGAARFE